MFSLHVEMIAVTLVGLWFLQNLFSKELELAIAREIVLPAIAKNGWFPLRYPNALKLYLTFGFFSNLLILLLGYAYLSAPWNWVLLLGLSVPIFLCLLDLPSAYCAQMRWNNQGIEYHWLSLLKKRIAWDNLLSVQAGVGYIYLQDKQGVTIKISHSLAGYQELTEFLGNTKQDCLHLEHFPQFPQLRNKETASRLKSSY